MSKNFDDGNIKIGDKWYIVCERCDKWMGRIVANVNIPLRFTVETVAAMCAYAHRPKWMAGGADNWWVRELTCVCSLLVQSEMSNRKRWWAMQKSVQFHETDRKILPFSPSTKIVQCTHCRRAQVTACIGKRYSVIHQPYISQMRWQQQWSVVAIAKNQCLENWIEKNAREYLVSLESYSTLTLANGART